MQLLHELMIAWLPMVLETFSQCTHNNEFYFSNCKQKTDR